MVGRARSQMKLFSVLTTTTACAHMHTRTYMHAHTYTLHACTRTRTRIFLQGGLLPPCWHCPEPGGWGGHSGSVWGQTHLALPTLFPGLPSLS